MDFAAGPPPQHYRHPRFNPAPRRGPALLPVARGLGDPRPPKSPKSPEKATRQGERATQQNLPACPRGLAAKGRGEPHPPFLTVAPAPLLQNLSALGSGLAMVAFLLALLVFAISLLLVARRLLTPPPRKVRRTKYVDAWKLAGQRWQEPPAQVNDEPDPPRETPP